MLPTIRTTITHLLDVRQLPQTCDYETAYMGDPTFRKPSFPTHSKGRHEQ
jgi:hypothetical protein